MMEMPDVTKAQILAVITWAAAQAVAYGWLKSMPSEVALSLGATVVAAAWKLADAYLRGQRANAVAANPAAFTDGSSTQAASPGSSTPPQP